MNRPLNNSTRDLEAPYTDPENLTAAVKSTLDIVTHFHDKHNSESPRLQRVIDRMTDGIGRPHIFVTLGLAILLWIVGNLAVHEAGFQPFDVPPFEWLHLTATCLALLFGVLILVTQRREDILDERRAQLMLELALLADKKTAKLIALMEEFRQDHPSVQNRHDSESAELAEPINAKTIMTKIDET